VDGRPERAAHRRGELHDPGGGGGGRGRHLVGPDGAPGAVREDNWSGHGAIRAGGEALMAIAMLFAVLVTSLTAGLTSKTPPGRTPSGTTTSCSNVPSG
jgi:hypothetical protein